MADDTDQEIGKLRRFALGVGLVLFTVAIAGAELQSPAVISPLGIPLHVKRPNLLGTALCVASVYATARYWLYAFVHKVSPFQARRRIRQGDVSGITTKSPSGFVVEVTALVTKYFPSVGKKKVTFNVSQAPPFILDLQIPPRASALAWLENLDYFAPLLVNGVALLTYFGVYLIGH